MKNIARNKNVSKTVENGMIIQTRDEYFSGQGSYRKPGYKNKGNYRQGAVIDSNVNNDLVVVKLYSHSGKEIPGSVSRFKPFVETHDDENKRIKIGPKFIPTKKRLSKHQVAVIKKDCFNNSKSSYYNKKQVRHIKGRK